MARQQALHAPWRLQYVLAPRPEGCFFCEAYQASPADWEKHLVLFRNEHCLVMLNRYPYTGGHLMVASSQHLGELEDASEATWQEMMRLARAAAAVLRATLQAQGMNIGLNLGHCAGAGVDDHLHVHIVPRWNGDTNFLPVLSGHTQIPLALAALWDKLRPGFAEVDNTASRQ